MSKNAEHVFVDVVETNHKSVVQRYLQNPFSIAWSKLSALTQSARSRTAEVQQDNQSEEDKLDSTQERYLYRPFTDRIDPSLYYAIFFHNQHL
ncbi:hypothetical protein CEN45_22260 [Fischerella thermalis CCMEE 5198]|jgi:hypothetical protein|uniref:hypothetical protein n=1 Tax=Fischerella thermalis TaxID=372787 RepID=UPI000C8009DC|nr:hypothetical protein [Fischerella thermalis]PMB01591.1 hypothetical protein CI594_09135 [Fischerella thermalis CCMEE 5196]PMB17365.1 hypothetical protein CEN45_22260 [Fischerella thermalis CCMEE 5198]PMB49158.1 hypothetical protein CEN39_21780 [Fischerella thermalis CCMEE 5201]